MNLWLSFGLFIFMLYVLSAVTLFGIWMSQLSRGQHTQLWIQVYAGVGMGLTLLAVVAAVVWGYWPE